ncbi:MAG: MFS transporter [Alphaproteobacteria bacterium]
MDRQGWRTPIVVLVCGTVVLLMSFGIRTSFGIFLQPVSDDLGWGREVFALAIAVQNLIWGLSQPIAGGFADKYGSGRVIAVCAVLYVVGVYLMGQVTAPFELTVSAGFLVGVGMSGTSFGVVLAVIGRSVSEERRSLFLGLGAAGGSSGQLLMVPLGQAFLATYGWATALVLLAALSLVMVPLAAALTGRAAAQARAGVERQSLTEAVREAGGHGGYWYLNAGFFVCGFHVMFIATHLPAYIVDNGVAAKYGAIALAVVGLGNILGSYVAGVLGGRFSKKYLLSALYAARAVIIAIFVLTPTSATSIVVFSFAIGILWLSTVPLTSGLVAQIFGVRYMATLFGIVFLSHQLGSFLGVWLGGYVYDATGSYDMVWWVGVALGVAAAALHWPINERPVPRLAAAAD